MKKSLILLIFLLMSVLQFAQAQSRPYLGAIRYTATTFTVFQIDAACYGPGVKIFVNNVDQTSSFTRGFCIFGICIYNFPFGTLRVGDVVKIEDFCGRISDPVTVGDDYAYVEVPSGASTGGNGIDANTSSLPFSALNTAVPAGKCSPITIGSHALHRIGMSYGTNSNGSFTGGTMKINGTPVVASDFLFEFSGNPTIATINTNGSLTYNGYAFLTSNQVFTGSSPVTFEYQHNGVLGFDTQESFFGPLGYRLWNNGRVTIKEYKYDGSVVEMDLNRDFTAANFKMVFGNGKFRLLINDVVEKSIDRTVIYTTTNGTIANTSLQAYGASTTWTPASSGTQYVTAIMDGIRQVRQKFLVADDMVIAETVVNVACNGGSNGSITVGTTGGFGSKTYSKDNGTTFQGSNVFAGLTAGTYSIQAKDASGCVSTKNVNVSQNTALGLTAPTVNNVSCSGGNNGSVTLSASGGIAPYQYRTVASGYGNSSTLTGLGAGTIAVYVKDAAGCETTINVTIGTNSNLTATQVTTNLLCNGISTGSIAVSQAGTASGAVQYSLDNVTYQGTATFSNLAANTYTVYVKDNLCLITISNVVVSQPAVLTPNVSVSRNVSCNGLSDGQITATASGGTGTTYYFSTDGINYTTVLASSHLFTGFAAGSYKVYCKDINGCVKDQIVTVSQPTVMTLALSSKVDATCFGANGSATVIPTGGTGPYTYKIGTTAYGSNVISPLLAGTYTVVATDQNACQASVSVQILQPSQITASASVTATVTCFGTNNGSTSVTASGGTGTLTYSNNGGAYQASPVFTGLVAGNYVVTVKDANNCTINTTSVNVSQPSNVVASVQSQTNVACFGGSTGSITLKAVGGISPYTFSKDGTNFGNDSTFASLIAGNYTFSLKDANGCLKTINVTVSQPTNLVVGISISQQVLCYNGNSGQITTTASGGVGPYQYALNTGSYANQVVAGSFLHTNLTIGTYQVSVKDANGCVKTTTQVVVTQPTDLVPSISAQTNVSCNAGTDGSVSLAATGGNASSYQYSKDGVNFQSSPTFSGLSTGTYTFTIKDANACIKTITTTVTQPAAPFTMILASSTNLSCYQNTTGVITVNTVGGTSPYTVSKDNITFQTPTTFSGLSAIAYVIYGKDAKGCTFSLPAVTLTQPTDISIALLRKNDVDCDYYSRGEALLRATGSNGNFNYTLSGSDFKFNPIAPISNTTGLFDNLKAGDYTLTATDQVGCAKPFTVTISNKNTTINFDLIPTLPSSCSATDGKIDIANMAGGRPPYQYSISSQNTATATPQFTGLLNGNYIVTVADDLCSYKKEVSLKIPSSLNVSGNISPISCLIPDANLSINASGGNGAYQYALNGGAFTANNTFTYLHPNVYSITVKDSPLSCQTVLSLEIKEQNRADLTFVERTNVLCFGFNTGVIEVRGNNNLSPFTYSINNGSFGSNGRFPNLTAGTYKLLSRNSFGCIDSLRATLTQPTLLTNATTKTDNLCFGDASGTITTIGNGGVTPYTFSKDGTNYQNTGSFSGLTAGTYTAYVKDNHQCVTPVSITLNQPTNVVVTPIYADTVRCFAESNGKITVNASGGTPAYQYSKDGSTYFSSNQFGSLSRGNYTLFVKDANQCVRSNTLTLTQPDSLKISLVSKANPLCYLGKEGSILVNAIGGNNGNRYTINADTTQASPNFTGLKEGNYSIVVVDRKGCTHSVNNIQLIQPPQLQHSIVTKEPLCFKDSNGKIDIKVTGGTMAYQIRVDGNSYQPVDGIRDFSFLNIPSRIYNFQTVDANGCKDNYTVNLKQPTALKMDVVATPNNCNGDSTGVLQLFGKGATLPYQYSVLNGYKLSDTTFLGTNYYDKLLSKAYLVRIKDGNQCRYDTLVTVKQPTRISFSTVYADTVRCFGEANGQLKIIANGGTPGYNYALDNQLYQSLDTLKGLKAGNYKVYVRDKNNCVISDQPAFKVSEPNKLILAVSSQSNPLCAGEQNGIIQIKAGGGNGGYGYVMDNVRSNAKGYFDSLSRGDYTFKVTDRRGCTDAIPKVTLAWPKALVSTITGTQPICFGDANSKIDIVTIGGITPYKAINGKDTLQFSNQVSFKSLKAGVYQVLVNDANGCFQPLNYTIKDAIALNPIVFTDSNTVCKNQEVTLTANNPTVSTEWFLDKTPFSKDNTITTKKPGFYSIIVTNPTGCILKNEFELKNRPNTFNADFLIPTQALIGDTVVCLDITKPIPTKVIWEYASVANAIIENNSKLVSIYAKEGSYLVRMIVANDACENKVEHTIQINPNNGKQSTIVGEDIIKSITITPNPSTGKFELTVRLSKNLPITVDIVQNVGASVVFNSTETSKQIHEIPIELNVVTGVYIVRVQAGSEIRSSRILINR